MQERDEVQQSSVLFLAEEIAEVESERGKEGGREEGELDARAQQQCSRARAAYLMGIPRSGCSM